MTVTLDSSGSFSGTIMVTADNVTVENNDTFQLVLASEDGSVSVMGGPATVTITDNTCE